MPDPLKKRLLIVDDEADFCEILKIKFEKIGFEVSIAGDGSEGFKKVQAEKPDCILLDVRFPQGEDGLTFLRRLRSFRHDDSDLQDRIRKIPVIVLTATGESMRPLFKQEGVQDFLLKPFDDKDLQDRVLRFFPSGVQTPL